MLLLSSAASLDQTEFVHFNSSHDTKVIRRTTNIVEGGGAGGVGVGEDRGGEGRGGGGGRNANNVKALQPHGFRTCKRRQ